MAKLSAVYSVGSSLALYLTSAYTGQMAQDYPCTFQQLATGKIAELEVTEQSSLATLLLYRVTFNEHHRHAVRQSGAHAGTSPLALDLHYLLTVWADNDEDEQVILTWAMRQLAMTPVLDRSILAPESVWEPGDSVRVVPVDMPTDALLRIWDAFRQPYRLSVPYLARIVHVDVEPAPGGRPVVATRLSYERHDPDS